MPAYVLSHDLSTKFQWPLLALFKRKKNVSPNSENLVKLMSNLKGNEGTVGSPEQGLWYSLVCKSPTQKKAFYCVNNKKGTYSFRVVDSPQSIW